MRFYKSIFHLWLSLLITVFELLGIKDNCLILESISSEVDFLKSSSVLFMGHTHYLIYNPFSHLRTWLGNVCELWKNAVFWTWG